MDKFSNDWDTIGGTCMGPSLSDLLNSRRMDLTKEMNMGSRNIEFLPSGGENFMKKGNQEYEWIADNGPIIQKASGDYFGEGETSPLKKINYGNEQGELKKSSVSYYK